MKKQKKSIEAVLARAEKLFQRGNFSLAGKEFEKAQKKLKCRDIAAKIKMCRKEAETLEGKELIKRARKAEKKGNVTEALACFEAAALIFNEDWITKRIGLLRDRSTVNNAISAAEEAEAAGDFQRAADLYAEACKAEETTGLLIKRAKCLLWAENYARAVAVFEKLTLSDTSSRYDYGLALAKTGRYGECLHVWERLETKDKRFAEQKRTVCLCLAADLFDRFAEKRDYAAIYRDALFLLKSPDHGLEPRQIRPLEDLREYAKYAWIEELWNADEYETIAGLLETGSSPMTPALLALHAKIGFKLALNDDNHLTTMLLYWVSAIYSRQITADFAAKGAEVEKVQQKLIDAAQNLIKSCADTAYGRRAATYLEIDQKLFQQLTHLVDQKKRAAHPVCTPLYAARFDKTADILSFIREKRDFFKNTENYLETGAYYSAAGKCLYFLENNEFNQALAFLDDLPKKSEGHEFTDYVQKRVHFEFGMYCMEKGDARLNGFYKAAPALFDLAPAYEKKFTEKALGVEEWDNLQIWVDALSYIHDKRPTEVVRQALSLVISRHAIAMSNKGKMSMKAVKVTAQKALQLYPENETALCALRDSAINFEIDEIHKAFYRHKLGKASQLALKSEYSKVRDSYFKFISHIFEDIMSSNLEHDEKLIMLNDVYEWASTVDTRQPVLGEIYSYLNMELSSR